MHPYTTCPYYKPTEEDQDSMLVLRRSIELIRNQGQHIWVLGDFNLRKLTWTDRSPSVKPARLLADEVIPVLTRCLWL